MAIRKLNEKKIRNVIAGATLLGAGGGGSMKSGTDLLERFKKDHPSTPIEVTLIETDDMDSGYAAVTAGMGSPDALKDINFTPYIVNAYTALQEVAEEMTPSKEILYSLAVEMGGFSTFIPMLISMQNGIAMIDADGAGRAVPALNTLLLHINGCETSPLAMANGDNDTVKIELNNPFDAEMGENIGRFICGAFGNMSGLSGWMVDKNTIKSNLPVGTITYAEKIGAILESYKGEDVFAQLKNEGGIESRTLVNGTITEVKTEHGQGFDYGKVTVKSDDGADWILFYQNENLLIYRSGEVVMTVPDIITYYSLDEREPVTNADIKEGMHVQIGAVKVDGGWWKNENKMFNAWKPFLSQVGYTGELVPYSFK